MMPQDLLDALVEEHLAVQQMMVEAAAREGQPSEAAYERLTAAFVAAVVMLTKHTVPVCRHKDAP